MVNITRRDAIHTAAVGLTAGVAGCSSNSSTDSTDAETQPASAKSNNATELQRRVEELEQRNEQLRKQANSSVENTDTLESELEAERERTKVLQQRLENKTETVSTLEQRVEKRESRIEQLESRLGSQFDSSTIQAATQVMNNTKPAVVYIDISHGNASSGGTGWFIDDTTIVTNEHIVHSFYEGNAETITVYTSTGDTVDVELAGMVNTWDSGDNHIDLAMLTTTEPGPYSLSTGDSTTLDDQQPLVQVGHPGGIGNWVGSLGVNKETHRETVTMDIPLQSGNSGSPVLTLDGNVVGITNSTGSTVRLLDDGEPRTDMTELFTDYPHRERKEGYAVPIESVIEYYNDWI